MWGRNMIDVTQIIKLINQNNVVRYTFDYSIYKNYILDMYNWYKGCTKYHSFKRYNGNNSFTVEKAKMYMAKRASEDMASLVCNDNIEIHTDEKLHEYLFGNDGNKGVLGKNDFFNKLNKSMEMVSSLGTAAIEVVLDNMESIEGNLYATPSSQIKLVRHEAMDIVPLCWDNNGEITEVMFLDEYVRHGDRYVDVRIHTVNEQGNYVIINRKFKTLLQQTTEVDTIFTEIGMGDSVVSTINTNSPVKWFTVFKLPIINNYDIKSPMGASIYGNCIDILKALDDAFSTLCGEFRTSEKKVFYDRTLLDRDSKGNVIVPDGDEYNKEIFFYAGSGMGGDEGLNDKIKEMIPTIRTKELSEGISLLLDIFSMKVGLGRGYYKFNGGTVQKTATEVINENSELYRNIKKYQTGINKNIYDIIQAVVHISNNIFGTSFNEDENVSIKFDASIVQDKESKRNRAMKEVELHILTPNEYRKEYYPDLGDINQQV